MLPRTAMSIRQKILAVTALLLLVFAATSAMSAFFIRRVVAELEAIADYHLELVAIVSSLDVETFEYELALRRLLQSESPAAEQIARTTQREDELAAHIKSSFRRAAALLDAATQDERNDVSDVIEMARIQGSFRTLEADTDPFLALGGAIVGDLNDGRIEAARSRLPGFAAYESAFGPQLAEIRGAVVNLTRTSARETNQQQIGVLLFNAVLFAVAAVVGFSLFAVLTGRLARSFRRLLDGTHAVETGELTVELPVTSQDEIGQLTRSFNNMVVELRAKEHIKDTFGKYLDPRIVNDILQPSNGTDAAERSTVTVLLSDIAGFTTMSEELTAQAMVNLLNRYFTVVTQTIRDRNGIVDKYIGDAVMAFWTPAFSADAGHATDACLAAVAQQQAIEIFRRELPEILGLRRRVPEFHVRIGITTGDVVVGTIGSAQSKSYTVIGDAVNVAARLEGVNKVYGTRILVAEDTYLLAREAIEAREIDLITVAGKSEPVRIYELLGAAGTLTASEREWRDLFAAGLAAYREADWDRAAAHFDDCQRLRPEDEPPKVFARRIGFLRENPPSSEWDRVWRLTEK